MARAAAMYEIEKRLGRAITKHITWDWEKFSGERNRKSQQQEAIYVARHVLLGSPPEPLARLRESDVVNLLVRSDRLYDEQVTLIRSKRMRLP